MRLDFSFLNKNLFTFLALKGEVHFTRKPFLLKQNLNPTEYFLVDRFLQHHPLIKDLNSWSFDLEKKEALLNEGVQSKIQMDFIRFDRLGLNEQVEYILRQEYGSLSADLADKDWVVKEVYLSSLKVQSEKYRRKSLIPERMEDYETQLTEGIQLVAGLFTPKNEYYRLVDGFHRLEAIKQFYPADELVSIITISSEY